MKMVVINQDNFDFYFQTCFDKLKLEMLDRDNYTDIYALHKKFHYEVAILKENLEKH